MLLELTLEQALSHLGEPQRIFDESVVPIRSRSADHSPYRPEYDWLFLFERKLARVLDPWLLAHRLELIGSGGLLSEALSNAFCHAHRRDPELPMRVQVFRCDTGLVVRLKDSGPGFAVDEVVAKYRAGAAYYHVAGNGLRRMIEVDTFGVFFTEAGSAFHLLHVFDTPPDDWYRRAMGSEAADSGVLMDPPTIC